MSKRWLNNFIAVCVVVLYMALLLVTAGCSGQGVKLDVETSNDKCGTKNVKFSTDYQVKQLEIGRTIEGGGTDGGGSEGCGGGYTVTLGEGTTKDAEMGFMVEMMRMMMGVVGLAPQQQAMASIIKDTATMNTQSASVQSMRMPGSESYREDNIFKAGMAEGRRQQTKIFNRDGAGNVWIDGRINPKLPLDPD